MRAVNPLRGFYRFGMGDPPRVVACVGGIVFDDLGRLLFIRRGRPPSLGAWSLPGGRVEPGETPEQAVIREVREETGLVVRVERLVGRVRRDGPAGVVPPVVYDIADFACSARPADPVAGDDATDVGWFAAADLDRLPVTPGLLDALRGWASLPR